jgi:Rrf2 family protein
MTEAVKDGPLPPSVGSRAAPRTGVAQCRVAVSARADYAVRALVALAMEPPSRPMKAATIAERQGIPARFLANILPDLCRAGVIGSRRGGEGGYWLARPASEITLADIIGAIERPVTTRTRLSSTPNGSVQVEALWSSVQQGLDAVLRTTRLLDVLRDRS